MNVGEIIKQRRIELGLSQDELAKKAGYKSRSSIQKIESSRNIPIEKITTIARILDIEASSLMNDKIRSLNLELKNDDFIYRYSLLSESNKEIINDLINVMLIRDSKGD